jgi:uncharacterized membrane protein
MMLRMSAALTALTGVFISAYLWLYKLGKIGTLTCGTGGCETVQLSPYSRFMGLEVAAIGAVGYTLLLVLSLASLNARPAVGARLITALVVLSGMALLFTLYLKYLELFVIHAICRWCVASAVLILVFFVLVVLERRRIGRPLA